MIDPVDLFVRSFDLVMLERHLAIERHCPRLCSDVMMRMGVFKELEFRYEAVFHELFPLENRSWWIHFGRDGVVFSECCAYCFPPGLKGTRHGLAKLVTYWTIVSSSELEQTLMYVPIPTTLAFDSSKSRCTTSCSNLSSAR